MIGNITKGNGFYGVCAYVMGKPGARVIGGNMAGTTPGELAWEFRKFSSLNDRASQPVLHLSFSPAPKDKLLSDLEYYCIAQDLLDGLELNKNQYLLALHYDAEYQGKTRPHAHMIINRVNIDGECNDAYKDYYRTELVLRQIETCLPHPNARKR
ncbi:relaxase/mobilization nuclease domain-containing protein [Scytonema sp. UIC 10036]|uniref:relaxase/mobilization nuclease domain-containing protein n=1 Tax=Scytonema sp. UIC 10036 TaxID=2304196 RepID=UPI0012DA8110|nr:relaxase/mobilization nuclease domain-containing protein [Scytonema sp. UIC 10036]